MRIGVGRYSNMLARFLTGTAELEVVPELSAEISPVFTLESERPEWDFLKGQRLPAASMSAVSSAISAATCRIRNPVGSNVLAVLLEGDLGVITATQRIQVRIGTATADLTTPMTGQASRDSRYTGTLGTGALKTSTQVTGGTGTVIYENQCLANEVRRPPIFPIILGPGSHCDFCAADTVIATVNVNLIWRERELTRYEI